MFRKPILFLGKRKNFLDTNPKALSICPKFPFQQVKTKVEREDLLKFSKTME